MDSQARLEQTFTGPASAARASGGSTAARQRARITEMNASMATITRRVLMTAERRAGR